MADLSGKSVGRYHILEPLGQGGMATVYKAFDTRLERVVAVKFIRMEQVNEVQKEEVLKRFEREAKALARLAHPNIVHVHDFGEYEGAPYLVMVYLTGGTLKSRFGGNPIPYPEAASLLLPVARALAYAHSLNIIHRDVKPANILLTASGEPMLSDFGVAKILQADELTLTGTGVGIGTPEYMAPEQWVGKAGAPADIYSLGVVLYELVTGKKPYTADTPAAILIKQMSEPLPPPGSHVPGLPVEVERVLYKALAKDPAQRYLTMTEFAAALEKLLVSPLQAGEGEAMLRDLKNLTSTSSPSPLHGDEVGGEVKRQNSLTPWLLAGATLTLVCLLAAAGVGFATGGFGIFKTSTPIETTAVARVKARTPTPTRRAATATISTYTFTPSRTPTPISTPTYTHTPSQTTTRTITSTPTLGIGSTLVSEKDGMVLVYVPEGNFLMGAAGSDTYAKGDERPQHTVWLDAFWIDKIEVTNALYQKCVKASGCTTPHERVSSTRSSYFGSPDYANYPVIFVDWNQANAYCIWAGRRLPSEAEWEKAARGMDSRIFPWGNADPSSSLLNFSTYVGDTTEVGQYPQGASPYGALDMAGNVWEWVNDWYQYNYYQTSPDKNPPGPSSGRYRVLRGGSWSYEYQDVRSSFRGDHLIDYKSYRLGFRCLVSP